jgi:hypothetical protein
MRRPCPRRSVRAAVKAARRAHLCSLALALALLVTLASARVASSETGMAPGNTTPGGALPGDDELSAGAAAAGKGKEADAHAKASNDRIPEEAAWAPRVVASVLMGLLVVVVAVGLGGRWHAVRKRRRRSGGESGSRVGTVEDGDPEHEKGGGVEEVDFAKRGVTLGGDES